MSTEKRDELVRDLTNGLIVYGAGDRAQYVAGAEWQVDGVVAEALRNAAERLRNLVTVTAAADREGLKLAERMLRSDADALERSAER